MSVIVTPGQDTALTLRNTIAAGLWERSAARRALDVLMGATLIGLGIRLAAAER